MGKKKIWDHRMSTQLDLELTEPEPKILASTIRFRPPNPNKHEHEFKVGDFVVIARLEHSVPTSREILHHCGVITEVDDFSPSSVEMRCASCVGSHTMHESELDLLEDRTVLMLREKTGVDNRPITKAELDKLTFEDEIAVLMHKAGFLRVAVEDRPIPFADPELPTPHWTKYVYGTIGQMAPFSVHAAKLLKVAHTINAHLVEWHCYNLHRGWSALTLDDMDTLTFDMPTRAVLQSKASEGGSEYDEAKDLAVDWLGSANQIDVEAICRGLKMIGLKVSNWDASRSHEETSFQIEEANDGLETANMFMTWAKSNWTWTGKYRALIVDTRPGSQNEYSVPVQFRLEPGAPVEVGIEEDYDVPF